MGKTIETVGIYLTEDQRRLLTSLVSDLEIREESALHRNEGPEAQTYAATREALRKLMHLPVSRAANVDRVRSVVLKIAGDVLEHPESRVLRNFDVARAIADRVAAQLGPVELTAEERTLVGIWRDEIRAEGERLADFGCESGRLAILDRLLTGACHS